MSSEHVDQWYADVAGSTARDAIAARTRRDRESAAPPLGAAAWLLAGLLLLAVGWLATPHPVPLYDGLGFPDQPYRYVQSPPGAPKAPPPLTVTARVDMANGSSVPDRITSAEVGPQVDLYLPNDEFTGPTPVTVEAEPRAPDNPPPHAELKGNVYVVTAARSGTPVAFAARTNATITLRAPSLSKILPVVAYRADPAQTWRILPTQRVGQDIFSAPLDAAGQYVIAVPDRASAATAATSGQDDAGGASGNTTLYLLLAAAVAIMALSVVALRVRAYRHAAAAFAAAQESDPPAEADG